MTAGDNPGLDVVHQRLIYGPALARPGRDVVVAVDPVNLPAQPLRELAALLLLAINTLPGGVPVLADANVNTCGYTL